jgi:quercetin dioxygenase-like cupin family protein
MEQLWFIANLAEVLVDREDFSLVRMHAAAGDQPPLHVHEHEDEGFYVLEGSLTLWVGDADPVTLVPGEFALAPHGIPHTYRVGDSRGLFLVTSAPGPFVSFLRSAGAPAARPELPVLDGPPDPERLALIAADHGITLLGPPGTLPA